MVQQSPKIVSPLPRKPWFNRLLKGLGLFLVLFLLFFFLFALLIQTKTVQNWLVDKVTTHLSEELQTEVSIEHIHLDFIDKLVLDNFYVEDFHGDTLMYSTALKVNLNTSISNLLSREVAITDIILIDPQFRLTRYEGEQDDQFKQLLEKLSNSNPKTTSDEKRKAGKPWFLDIEAVYLDNAVFIKEDSVGGEEIKVVLPRGEIFVDSLDLTEKLVKVNKAILTAPYVTLINFEKKPIIDTTVTNEAPSRQPTVDVDSLRKKWWVQVSEFQLEDGFFGHDNFRKSLKKTSPSSEIDFNHLAVSDINIHLSDFTVHDWVFQAKAEQFSLKESAGFVIDNITAEHGLVAPDRVELRGMQLITPYSHLKDSLIFKFNEYPDFKDFPNKVWMHGDFDKASIALKDIMHFAPKLKRNEFFAQNKNEVLYIDGVLRGRINSLTGKRLNLNLGDAVRLKGNFTSRNLTNSRETFLSMDCERLQTSMTTLRSLIPNLTLPDNFNKLGKLDFNGGFWGFFSNFNAKGTLATDLGDAKMDMTVDWRAGRELAIYNGGLDLINFDLGRWTDNKDFGIVSFTSAVDNGKGLTLSSADATLKTTLEKFYFKGYTYENLTLDGHLNKDNFDGTFSIEDDNIALDFKGEISDLDEFPNFVFEATVRKLDAKKLNLIKQDFVFSGNLDVTLRGNNINDLQGIANFNNIIIVEDSSEVYTIKSFQAIYATQAVTDLKSWSFSSEILDAGIVGDFDIHKVQEALLQFVEKNYPLTSERFNIKSKGDRSFVNNQFELTLDIHDTKNLTHLIDKKLDTIKNTQLMVNFDYKNDSFLVDLDLPFLRYDNFEFDSISLKSEGLRDQSNIDFQIASSNLNDQLQLAPVTILSWIENDSMAFSINTKDFEKASDRLNLQGEFSLVGELFNFRFKKDSLVILNDDWEIADDNYLQIGPNFIKTNNFELSRGDQKVALHTIADKGLVLDVDGFNTSYINEIWSYQNLQFDGIYNIQASVADLFKMEGLELNAKVDSFLINDDPYGLFRIEATADNIKSPVNFSLFSDYTTEEKAQTMEALNGRYNPPTIESASSRPEDQPNFLSVTFDIENYPLKIAEYFVTSGISGTKGDIKADLSFEGLLPKPDVDGTITVSDGQTTIDYTGTTYKIEKETALMNDKYLLDATGSKIIDTYGNIAYVDGGITHDFFKNLGLDVVVTAEKFLVIDTQKEDNEVYYGTGIAGGTIVFSGDFNATNIDINATTAEGSEIFIPVSSSNKIQETSFIRFESKKDTIAADSLNTNNPFERKGIKLDIELALNSAATVHLIFDEQAGDIMQGTGFGNINFEMTREGEISMHGHYEIEQGSYLFTAFNLVNKPFTVKRGGTIDWTGDPYNALINIDAEYADLYTTPYPFIIEYLNDDFLKQEARQSTNVTLGMKLTERLMQPTIKFDIDFPNLTGEIKNYTDSKLRSIRQDQNELNRQVFGLVVIGSFLPSKQGGLQGRELLTGINTLSELLSNQLSIYLTEVLSNAVNGKAFSLEDFDIDYSVYEASFNPNNTTTLGTGHEVHLRQRSRIRNRWVLHTSVDFDIGGSYLNNTDDALVTGDFIIEYELTKDRRLKVRGYYKNEPELFGGRRNNAGLGLSFRREFDSLDLLSFLKKNKIEEPPIVAEKNPHNTTSGNK